VLLTGLLGLASLLSPAEANTPTRARLTAQEKRGKEIYLRGTSLSSKEITATLSDGAVSVPGATMPCASCHGLDGAGRAEGGVTPSDITWEALTKSYSNTQSTGREHSAYTERSLEYAITRGRDPAGNKLHALMPRYRIAPDDLSDLIAYLKRLGKDLDPGITDASITVGTVLPAQGPMAEVGRVMKSVMSAYFEEVNKEGGIYNRRIDFRIAEPAQTAEATSAKVKDFVEREEVFAMAGAFIAGADKELASLIEKEEVPLVGPWTLYPQIGFPLNRHVFYLLPGLREQARTLVDLAAQSTNAQSPTVAIVYSENNAGVADAIKEQCKILGWSLVRTYAYSANQFDAARLAKELGQQNPQALFFLGKAEELKRIFKENEATEWAPKVFLPGSLAGKEVFELPPKLKDKVFLSFSTVPQDQTAAGVAEYRALASRYNLPSSHMASQLLAYCSARILVHGLKLAGKNLSREKLITVLESLNEFNTGLIPPLTFGPNRRIGSSAAYFVMVDLEKKNFIRVGDRLPRPKAEP
jgi:ABC-type branched-subunit amino acid transport system substrate-binding protein